MGGMAVSVVRVKPGVRFDVIAPAGFRILSAIDALAVKLGRDITLTCGTDFHQMPDPHCTGEAYDFGITGWSAQEIELAVRFLRLTLGDAFTVLYEVPRLPMDPTLRPLAYVNANATGPHFHIQRKKGTTWPPGQP